MEITATPPYTTDSVQSADGTTIGYRKLGRGPGLILVHGGAQYSGNFMKLAKSLSDAYTLYIPDRRGRGLSGPHGEGHNIAKECQDLAALADKTGTNYLFGLSAGALICLQSSLVLPQVRKAALYEPPLSIHHSYSAQWVHRMDSELAQGKTADAMVTVFKGVQMPWIFTVMPRFILRRIFQLAIERADKSRTTTGEIHPLDLIPTMSHDAKIVLELADKEETFKNVQAEVLLLGGSKSLDYLRKALEGLSEVLPHCRRVTFPSLDHLGPDNAGKPEIVAAELRNFFAGGN